MIRQVESASFHGDFTDRFCPAGLFEAFIFLEDLSFVSAYLLSANLRKISPRTGVEYSVDFKSELALSVSALCQRVASRLFKSSFFITANKNF